VSVIVTSITTNLWCKSIHRDYYKPIILFGRSSDGKTRPWRYRRNVTALVLLTVKRRLFDGSLAVLGLWHNQEPKSGHQLTRDEDAIFAELQMAKVSSYSQLELRKRQVERWHSSLVPEGRAETTPANLQWLGHV